MFDPSTILTAFFGVFIIAFMKGGFAAAIAFMIRRNWAVQPDIVIVEPDMAACLAESAKAKQLVTASGGVSEMGRLNCKDASLLAYDALSRLNVSYERISDKDASKAVKNLGMLGIHTTPSGAAGFAAMQENEPSGTSLIVVTEGQV